MSDPKTALVATPGGHLVQLDLLGTRLPGVISGEALWISHDTEQARQILDGRNVVFVPFVHARDTRGMVGSVPAMRRLLKSHGVDELYSTGAALGLAACLSARSLGLRSVYIESLARTGSPSLTGRVLHKVPGVATWTQYASNVSRGWEYRISALGGFEAVQVEPRRSVESVFVTVGTVRTWGFDRLIDALTKILPSTVRTIWQTGSWAGDLSSLPGVAVPYMSDSEVQAEMLAADVVVTHSGVGSAIRALQAGKVPVLVPRRREFGEHIDDHQVGIATELESRGLAIRREAHNLEFPALVAAANMAVVETEAQ